MLKSSTLDAWQFGHGTTSIPFERTSMKVDRRRGGEMIDGVNQALSTLESLEHLSQPNWETDLRQ